MVATTNKENATRNYIKNWFWNPTERRVRAGWRILLHLFLLVLLVLPISLLYSLFVEQVVRPLGGHLLFVRLAIRLIESSLTWIGIIVSLMLAGRFLDRRAFKDFGFALDRRWWQDLGFGLLLGALLMTGVYGVEIALGWVTPTGFFETNSTTFAAGIWLYIGLFIAVGIQEEVLTRGYWLRNIAEGFNFRHVGPKSALLISYVISSAVFGLLHLGNPNATWVSTVNLMLAGLMLGLPYVLTGQLALPIGLHITWNFFQGNVFGFPVSGSIPGTSYIAIQQTGPELWTGGAFGPEAGLIGLLTMLIGAGLIWVWLKLTHATIGWQIALASYAAPIVSEPETPLAGTLT